MPDRLSSLAVLVVAALVVSPAIGQLRQFTPYSFRGVDTGFPAQIVDARSFAVADLDGDGIVEIVESNALVTTQVLARSTPGAPWIVRTQSPSLIGRRIVAVDLDNDGDRDLIGLPLDSAHPLAFDMLRNDGTSLAIPATQFPGNGQPVQGVAAGDVDGDGYCDLVLATTVTSGTPALRLYRGSSSLTFTPDLAAIPSGMPFGLWPHLADFDQDGDLDVVATTAAAGVVYLRNNGAGVFTSASATMPVTHIGHTTSTVGDFDGDGRTDVLLQWWTGDLEAVWGGASGLTYQPALVPGLAARTLQPADIDGDGDLDVLVEGAAGIRLLRNLGGRQFSLASTVGEPVVAFGSGDVDLDGSADLLFATAAAPRSVNVWYSGQSVTADIAIEFGFKLPTTGTRSQCPLAGDVDGDGYADVLVPSTVGLIADLATGDGRYTMVLSPLVVPGTTIETAGLGDVDGDGDLDYVVSGSQGLTINANNGSGVFTPLTTYAVVDFGVDTMRVRDLDGNGVAEIVRADGSGVNLFRHVTGSLFARTPLATIAAAAVEIVDLDGDGDLDIVTGAPGTGGSQVFLGDGTGAFNAAPFAVDFGVPPRAITALDIDSDGDQDLLAATSMLVLMRNDGGGVFTDATGTWISQVADASIDNMVAADFDADGDVDVFVQAARGRLLINNGSLLLDLTLTRLETTNSLFATQRANAADIDGDGDLDLMTGMIGPTSQGVAQTLYANNLRQLRSRNAARMGGVGEYAIASGPGFGTSGFAIVAIAAAPAVTPLPLPFPAAGRLQIDPATLVPLGLVQTSPSAEASLFQLVPLLPALYGLEFWLQAAVIDGSGAIGLTNSIVERVLR